MLCHKENLIYYSPFFNNAKVIKKKIPWHHQSELLFKKKCYNIQKSLKFLGTIYSIFDSLLFINRLSSTMHVKKSPLFIVITRQVGINLYH